MLFHRDNQAPQESGVQRAHRDREERLVIWAELDQLASRFISYFTYTSHTAHHKDVVNEASFYTTLMESALLCWSNWRHVVFHRAPRVQMVARVPKDQWYVQLFLWNIYNKDTKMSHLTWLTLHRVILVHKVQAAILDPMDHQDLREALVSLVSKDHWWICFMFFFYCWNLFLVTIACCAGDSNFLHFCVTGRCWCRRI